MTRSLRRFRVLALAVLALSTASAEASHDRKVLLAGDSWGALMCFNRSLHKTFSHFKEKNVDVDCSGLTKLGARADWWIGSKEDQKVRKSLRSADVKVLYLSLGGNDYLYKWKKHFSLDEENALAETVLHDLRQILSEYQAINPGLKILLSGYDYGNFVEFTHFEGYIKLYRRMGEPTPYEINTAFLRYSDRVATMAQEVGVSYIHHFGLMHFYNGSSRHGLRAERTLPPSQISPREDPTAYGGDPRFENDRKSMMHILSLRDPFHLSPKSFERVGWHAYENYLKDWLRD